MASKRRRRALYERHPVDWKHSLQREGSLSMSPGVEVLLRRRLEEHEHQERERDEERERERSREQEHDDDWRPQPLIQRRQHMLTDLDELSSPPSAPATFRSPPRAGCAGPPPSVPPPAVPPPVAPALAAPCYPPAATPGPGAAPAPGLGCPGGPAPPPPAPRQPVYHRLNPDVFFMAADRSAGDALSWRSRDYRHTQV